MSDTTIDTIFAEFGRKCSPIATLRNVDNPLVRREYIDQAKSALYELMLSVIGEDELPPVGEMGGFDPVTRTHELITDSDAVKYHIQRTLNQNNLRAEQRNKLKELMK